MALLLIEEITVSTKYADIANIFSKKSAKMLPERISINKHAIKCVNSKQSPYGPIYNLDPVALMTLKTYIETNQANSFIKLLILQPEL